MSISLVSPEVLERLWTENQMSEKRSTGILTERIVHQTAARNPRYAGGASRIILLITPRGQHIGTIHEVVQPDGTVEHSHAKDYMLRDCSRVRVLEEPF